MDNMFEDPPAIDGVMFDDLLAEEGATEEDGMGASHDRLLQRINQLDSKRAGRSIIQRSEASAEVSEFHMATEEGAGVNVKDLLASLGDQARHATLRKEINKAQHQKKLPPPLEKPQAVKAQRKAGYEKVTKEVSRWENVVKQRRRAAHVSFPLEKPELRVETGAERTAAFIPQTPLEQEIAVLLGGSASVVQPGQMLSEAERRALAAMSLDEALERRRELAKHRALLTYQEAKQRRQNKIKSRKYRRVLKKERLKQHLKEFEQLKICDPEAALAKLQEMERQRVEERMSQRHKNTGKWARLQAIKRKYDPAAREALAENLRIGRERTQKAARDAERDASEDEAEPAPAPAAAAPPADPDNPWMAAAQPTADAYSGEYTRFWAEQEAAKQRLRQAERQAEPAPGAGEEEEAEERPAPRVTAEDVAGEADSDEEEGSEVAEEAAPAQEVAEVKGGAKKALKRKADAKTAAGAKKKLKKGAAAKKKAEDIDEIFDTFEKTIAKKTKKKLKQLVKGDETTPSSRKLKKKKNAKAKKERPAAAAAGSDDDAAPPAEDAPELDPSRFMAVEPRRLRSLRPDGGPGGEDDLEDGDDARMTIAEAFADDDVVAEFREEKEATIDADKPKDIDMALPGWGDWGGQNIKMSAKKRRRLLFRAPKGPPRKDHHLGHVILSEKRNEALRAHQPSELPYYVSSVAAFEASIRAPVGRTWLPARAHDQLTQPAVSTRAGTLIPPMDEAALLNVKTRRRRKQK
ncbi:U3 small nucleolar RNA-associated protein 14 homolog A-like [Pollicipes pollicipes]|uniref:U3 small nucleolar RNA-associated protein 14 homolog A-like n=1 Tax=Pollicipes pollicipes TaxID=41117 RepID=UPI001884DCCF|nr:U3 small nucleolar RNA-associated protein 14 homolog A-like [Pollicipes pollicipes]